MNLFPALQPRSAEENVGTPERPIDAGQLARVPTGRNAQRSTADRWKRYDKKDEDAFFPTSPRQQRRQEARAAKTTQRKHQRGYFNRELAKENAARDLLNLFLLADGGQGVVSPIMRNRAQQRLAERVAYLRDQQQKAYDKALDARRKNSSLPAPTPPQRHEEIRAELWRLAQTATLPAAKDGA